MMINNVILTNCLVHRWQQCKKRSNFTMLVLALALASRDATGLVCDEIFVFSLLCVGDERAVERHAVHVLPDCTLTNWCKGKSRCDLLWLHTQQRTEVLFENASFSASSSSRLSSWAHARHNRPESVQEASSPEFESLSNNSEGFSSSQRWHNGIEKKWHKTTTWSVKFVLFSLVN